MKHLFHFICISILLTTIISCSKTDLDSPIEQDGYMKMQGSYYNDYINSSCPTSDGGILISGYTMNESSNQWAYISKADKAGMVVWNTTYYNTKISQCLDGIELSTPGTYACINSNKISIDSSSIKLQIINEDGNVTDSATIEYEASRIIGAQIFEDEENNLLIFSQLSILDRETQEETHFFNIHKVDNQNNISQLYSQRMSFLFMNSFSGIKHSSGRFFVTATVYSDVNENNSLVWVFSLKDNLFDWSSTIGDGDKLYTAEDLCISGDTLSIVGNTKTEAGAEQSIHVVKVSVQGEHLEDSNIELDNSKTVRGASIDINDNGNYVISGEIETGSGSNDILFIECVNNGDILSQQMYGSDGKISDNNKGKRIHHINGSGYYYLIGEMEAFNNYDICILKIDSDGNWIKGS